MIISNKKNKSVQGFSNTTIQLFSAFITVLIYNLIRQAVSGSFNLNISRSDILPILLLGVLNTGIGCYLYFVGIIKIPAQTVAVCDYLEPMTGIFFSALILHETIGPEKNNWRCANTFRNIFLECESSTITSHQTDKNNTCKNK